VVWRVLWKSTAALTLLKSSGCHNDSLERSEQLAYRLLLIDSICGNSVLNVSKHIFIDNQFDSNRLFPLVIYVTILIIRGGGNRES
jgi:hypothetical protein